MFRRKSILGSYSAKKRRRTENIGQKRSIPNVARIDSFWLEAAPQHEFPATDFSGLPIIQPSRHFRFFFLLAYPAREGRLSPRSPLARAADTVQIVLVVVQSDGLSHQIGVAVARHEVTEEPSLELVSEKTKSVVRECFQETNPVRDLFFDLVGGASSEQGNQRIDATTHTYTLCSLCMYRSRQRFLAGVRGWEDGRPPPFHNPLGASEGKMNGIR